MAWKLAFDIFVTVHDEESELDKAALSLLQVARQATQTAYAPYSNFYVGAAILLDDGTVVRGNNQENAAYPSGLCAERTAIFAAGANYPSQKVIMVAVTARRKDEDFFIPANPCGACRQVLAEYQHKQASPIRVIMEGGQGKIYVCDSVDMLLPMKFTSLDL
ncbi:MAG: cytidine deaminase [Cytophagales bacterium]|nr:MAG: cytidine deaminase [Cytophagales bacterium]